jgi:phosphoglycolate phosphatase
MGGSLQVVLFDLDGTLSDSAPGILASLDNAFSANGLPPLDEPTARSLLGPPFAQTFPHILGGHDLVPQVIASYRAHYGAVGMYETAPYRGIPELLAELASNGIRMAVATSKLEEFAGPIVAHLGLADYFETLCGDLLGGGRGSKALVIAEALRRLGDPDPSGVLMVGDRRHDVEGARAVGIRCAGAGWGYGDPGELAAAGADPICATPAELADQLRRPLDATAR